MTILEIDDLKVRYRTTEGEVFGVDGVSLAIGDNDSLGVVGESGSGKTTLARSINRVMAKNAYISDGSIRYNGTDLTKLSERELRQIRWEEIAMIPQSAMNALDPVHAVGDQFVETIRAHRDMSRPEARAIAGRMFELVGLEKDRLDDYPHEFSGGMKQRAMIALALVLEPDIVIADEPTTALDVIIQSQILREIENLQKETDSILILITHDISVVSEVCNRIAVFYGGRLVEIGEASAIINEPYHPYTMGLRNAFPSILRDEQELVSIPGNPPDLVEPPNECRFVDRCPFAQQECHESHPEPQRVADGHFVECHRADEADTIRVEARKSETWEASHDA